MRSVLTRLAALVAGVFVVVSCESRLPTSGTLPPGTGTGNTGGTGIKGPGFPTVSIDSPQTNALVNVTDSVLVVMKLHDDKGLTSATVMGVSFSGSADLGTLSERTRFGAITIPAAGGFRTGLRDTTVRRYLKTANAADTSLDSLIIRAIVRDNGNSIDTAHKRVNLVAGPKVGIVSPVAADSVPAGVGLGITAKANHPDGIAKISIRVQGEANWPTKLDTTITQTFTGAPRDQVFNTVARIPLNAPTRSRVIVSATSSDVNGQPGGSSPVTVYVRSAGTAQPRVNQVVLPRAELGDTIQVKATGDGIASIGYVARDANGNIIKRDSILLSQPYAGNIVRTLTFDNLPPTYQGKKVAITAFAVDQSRRTGYAVRPTQGTPEATLANALADSTLVVYGRTFPLPRQGVIGDIAVDVARGNVIVSNTQFNRLEVWQNTSRTFDGIGIAVGSLPWGLFISNNPDTLLVANSGGTNISRVFIGSTNVRDIKEDAARRILTRGSYIFVLNETRDENTQKVSISAGPPIIFSDRPQYIGQIASGQIFYSTRPTPEAPQGTIRYLNPSQPVPDPKPILIVRNVSADLTNYVVVNADSVFVRRAAVNSQMPDTLVMYDHPPGTLLASDSVTSTTGIGSAVAALRALNSSDVSYYQGIDVTNAGLTDTTYVSISGDHRWIAFGSGHTAGSGTIMMASSNFFSPPITQVDLTSNASEKVNGIALDYTGQTLAAHGAESFFASVDVPFHLRLQGKYQGFASGAGIAFHPQAAGVASPDQSRTAFVASGNKTIEVVDIFHYINRGRLDLKGNLYGPLRATLPLPGDPADVILKLFGITNEGLVVIDLRVSDILAVP